MQADHNEYQTGQDLEACAVNYIRDDKPSAVDRSSWIEFAPRGLGMCLVEVYTG